MKKLLSFAAIILAIAFLIIGLVFLIAANSASRFLTAVALLAAGCALIWVAIRNLRRIQELSPENLETSIVDLARRLGGEVSVAQVRAEFRISQVLAIEALERLRRQGISQVEPRGERVVYLFKGVIPAKAIRKCPYCGSEFPVRQAMRSCPNCGGNLELTKT